MKHAYLIVAHDNFNTLKKIIKVLDYENNVIFVLIDKKSGIVDRDKLIDTIQFSKIYFIPRVDIHWAGFSQIKATLALLETATKSKCDYYHLISGSDLPIKSQEYIQKYFEVNRGYEFVDYEPKKYEFAKYKANYYHFFVDNNLFRKSKIIKIINHLIAKIQQKLNIKRSDEKFFHGSNWFSITHECALYIISKKEEIYKKFKYTLACDEVFLQTTLYNSPFKEKIRYFKSKEIGNLRYIDWDRREGNSPYTFRNEDFEKIINAREDLLFARKFDERIDENIINKVIEHITL